VSDSAAIFHEEQKFRLKRQRALLAIPPVGMALLVIWQVVLGHPWGRQPMSNNNVMGWTIFLWLVYLRLVTVRLVTEVRTGELAVAMRGLWGARRIPLGEIKSVKTVTCDPVRDYGGYGIRTTRSGKAYTAGGNRGVRLELARGGTVLIGSERPEELVSAIKGYAAKVSSA
jgi:hypothetical protein